MAKSRLLATSVLGLALAGLCACTAASPANPSFATDVQPIFVAHCTRCHGGGPDGGLQGDPAVYPLGTPPAGYDTKVPVLCHLDVYEDTGGCAIPDGSVVAPATCRRGANYCAATVGSYIRTLMPPPPAPKLNDWELDVVSRWIMNPLP